MGYLTIGKRGKELFERLVVGDIEKYRSGVGFHPHCSLKLVRPKKLKFYVFLIKVVLIFGKIKDYIEPLFVALGVGISKKL